VLCTDRERTARVSRHVEVVGRDAAGACGGEGGRDVRMAMGKEVEVGGVGGAFRGCN
jgi:transcription antitermination factor NusA-like protein